MCKLFMCNELYLKFVLPTRMEYALSESDSCKLVALMVFFARRECARGRMDLTWRRGVDETPEPCLGVSG